MKSAKIWARCPGNRSRATPQQDPPPFPPVRKRREEKSDKKSGKGGGGGGTGPVRASERASGQLNPLLGRNSIMKMHGQGSRLDPGPNRDSTAARPGGHLGRRVVCLFYFVTKLPNKCKIMKVNARPYINCKYR